MSVTGCLLCNMMPGVVEVFFAWMDAGSKYEGLIRERDDVWREKRLGLAENDLASAMAP